MHTCISRVLPPLSSVAMIPSSGTRLRIACAFVFAISCLSAAPLTRLFGQGTDASIRGQLTDSAGAAIAGATIEIRNLASGFVAQSKASERGDRRLQACGEHGAVAGGNRVCRAHACARAQRRGDTHRCATGEGAPQPEPAFSGFDQAFATGGKRHQSWRRACHEHGRSHRRCGCTDEQHRSDFCRPAH